ncbi:hypothetical protein HDF18_13065 [Mucilaginibacter sp. X5P1]|uniref:hypothetical protein n=1 Tax=Mucilaginibacter sp. X5P1 TaxID=2723088 RepID=UPI00160DFD9A|nr:hypothetical protein [Mucilaginibacter sp. X5P1]MBB6141731.1 hypothetical protein [Mucilaginibacter sp. X5P1]
MKLKTGKDEIVYLLTKVIEKYELEGGTSIIKNTNRKNYEDLAKRLSLISNELPSSNIQFGHDIYPPDTEVGKLEFPHRKYDITSSQIKDAYNGVVNNPRPFLIDACYIYLYGMGRKAFEENPQDQNLIYNDKSSTNKLPSLPRQNEEKIIALKKRNNKLYAALVISLIGLVTISIIYVWNFKKWQRIKKDYMIMPYQPTQAEIDSLSGIWVYYTGAPQARASDSSRYHKVVNNILEIKYNDGYFTFSRFGANINHTGYMQFEAPNLVFIKSHIMNDNDEMEGSTSGLMLLDSGKKLISSIATTWSFDRGGKDDIIGARNVYIKQGKGGVLENLSNTPENASCNCKIYKWIKKDNSYQLYYLKYSLLDTISIAPLKDLLNEKSIILRNPQNEQLIKH